MKPQDWQPIDTAPKDLTEVLVYDADTEFIYAAQWEMHAQPPYWSYDTHDLTLTKRQVSNPTHWMPLPAPPSDRQERLAPASQEESQ